MSLIVQLGLFSCLLSYMEFQNGSGFKYCYVKLTQFAFPRALAQVEGIVPPARVMAGVGGLLRCSLFFVPLFSTARVIFRDMNADINLFLLLGWFLDYIYPRKRCFLVLTWFFQHGLLDFACKQWHYLHLNKRCPTIRCAVNLLHLGLDIIRMMMPL